MQSWSLLPATGLDLAAPLRFSHAANLPFANRGTGISFQPATSHAHSSNEPIQPLGTGVTLDKPLAKDHAIDSVVQDVMVKTAGYQGTPAPNQWFGGPALFSDERQQFTNRPPVLNAGNMVLRDASGLVVDSLNYGGLVDPWALGGLSGYLRHWRGGLPGGVSWPGWRLWACRRHHDQPKCGPLPPMAPIQIATAWTSFCSLPRPWRLIPQRKLTILRLPVWRTSRPDSRLLSILAQAARLPSSSKLARRGATTVGTAIGAGATIIPIVSPAGFHFRTNHRHRQRSQPRDNSDRFHDFQPERRFHHRV